MTIFANINYTFYGYGKNGDLLTRYLPRSATLNATVPFFPLLPSVTWVLSRKGALQGLNMRQLGDIEFTVLGPVKRISRCNVRHRARGHSAFSHRSGWCGRG
jgi:hypothetical protein